MQLRTLFFFVLLCGCTHTSNFIAENQELNAGRYVATFTHNEAEYAYTSGKVTTETSETDFKRLTTTERFYQGDSLHLTLIVSAVYKPGTRAEEIRRSFTGNLTATLNPEFSTGEVYFKPVFHKSDNGGGLLIDGEQFLYLNGKRTTDFYPDGGKDCFDVEFEFDLFANATSGPCGYDLPSCFNLFTQGIAVTKICL